MNRRLFLKTLGATATVTAFSDILGLLGQSRAQTLNIPYFVMVRMEGGWDVTLGLDPKVHSNGSTNKDMFIEYRPDEILQAGSLRLGPALAPLAAYANQMSIINGIVMNSSDNGHPASLNFMTTGEGSGGAPSLAIEIANSTQFGPFGVVSAGQVSALNRQVPINSAMSLYRLKNVPQMEQFTNFLSNIESEQDYFTSIQGLIENKDINKKIVDQLVAVEGSISGDYFAMQANGIAAAFAAGGAYQAQIDISDGSLDTHDDHEGNHFQAQTARWQKLAQMFEIFKNTPHPTFVGSNLFDHTCFMVISEFARTPALNEGKGKDHNPMTNSVLLAGAGFKTGVTLGESHLIKAADAEYGIAEHNALPINFKTGQIARSMNEAKSGDFKFITPDRLIATVAKSLGVDSTKFKSASLNAPLLNNLIRS